MPRTVKGRDADGVAFRVVAPEVTEYDGVVIEQDGVIAEVVRVGYGDGDELRSVSGDSPLPVKQSGTAPPLGYEQLTVAAAAVGLPDIPDGAVVALIVPEADIRWRDDGDDPTAGIGMKLREGQPLAYQGALEDLAMIAVTGNVEVNVSYYGDEA